MKVQVESYATELNRLNQEVSRLGNVEEEVVNIKQKYGSKSSQKIDELVKTYEDLEKKFNELQESDQKPLQDYQGWEDSKIGKRESP